MKSVVDHVGAVTGAILGLAGVIALMNAYYAHQDDMVRRDLLSESRRYAEVEKFYTDQMLEGVELSESQKKRLALVQKEQSRIADILLEDQ